MATNTTTNDLLSAIDSYMKSNGKGVHYIASKMADIFDNKDAPLNPKSGPLSLIQEIFEDLQIAMETLYKTPTSVIPSFKKELGSVNKAVKKFNTKLRDIFTSMDTFDNYILNLVTVGKNKKPVTAPYQTSQAGFLKVSLWGYSSFWSPYNGIPVSIRSIHPDIIKQIQNSMPEKVLRSAPTVAAPIPIVTKSVLPPNNNNSHNEPVQKKSGIWSTLFGIMGLGATVVGIGHLANELEKTPEGIKMKEQIKQILGDGVSKLFTKIGKFITSPETQAATVSGLKIVWSAFKWVGRDIYTKITNGNYTAGIVEALTSWLILRNTPLIKWIIRPLEGVLKKTFGSLFGGLSKGLSSIKWTGVKSLAGGLAKFAGRALVIYGIYEGIMSIYDSGSKIAKIVSDMMTSSEKALEVNNNMKKGWDAKNAARNSKLQIEINELEEKKMRGTITMLEESSLNQKRILQYINDKDAQLEAIAKKQGDRQAGFFGWFNGAAKKYEIEQENAIRKEKEELNRILQGYKSKEKSLKNKDLTRDQVSTNDAQRDADQIRGIKAVAVQDATVIQPNSKDQILMAKTGGPFDLAMKQMNRMMNEKLDELINVAMANVQATMSGSKTVAQTIAATAGNKSSPAMPSFNGPDPIRAMRNQVNSFVH